jgi:heparanase 1
VLTRERWDDVLNFAQRNGLPLVFTLNAGPGVRDEAGAWDGDNAVELMRYATARGVPPAIRLGPSSIFWFVHGLDAQVNPRRYVADLREARRLLESYSPTSKLGAQGSAIWPILGEPLGLFFGYLPDYLRAGGGDPVDLISWHYYPQQSRRGPIATRRASPARLLDPAALDEAGHWARQMNGCATAMRPAIPSGWRRRATPNSAASRACRMRTSAGCGGWTSWGCWRERASRWWCGRPSRAATTG